MDSEKSARVRVSEAELNLDAPLINLKKDSGKAKITSGESNVVMEKTKEGVKMQLDSIMLEQIKANVQV